MMDTKRKSAPAGKLVDVLMEYKTGQIIWKMQSTSFVDYQN